MAGKLEFADEATMKRLLVFDYFRGPDSTGFAALRKDKSVHLSKLASVPTDLFQMKKFTDALSGFNSTVFLGHNRLATKGLVNNYNAHPYSFDKADGSGSIVGAHNGTLDVTCWRELEEALGEKFEVDSMAVIAAIAKLGIEGTIPLLRGAWALTWFDTGDNTFNFIRNKERPFWYAYTDKFDTLIWASEWQIIHAATELSTKTYKLYEKDNFRYWAAEEDWWYKFDLDKLKDGAAERPKPRLKMLKGKEPLPAGNYYHNGVSPFPQRKTPHGTISTPSTTFQSTSKEGTTGSKDDKTPSVLHVTTTGVKPFGEFLSKEEFDKCAKYGCAWCAADVEYEEPGCEVFVTDETVLCPSCAGSTNNSRIYVDASRMVG